jgi:type I restriction enzyme S subunit
MIIEVELKSVVSNQYNARDRPAPAGEWGVLMVSAVQPDGFQAHENKLITNPSFINPAYEVNDGDLLITRSNTYQLVGIVCLVRSPQPRLMLCDKTLRLRFRSARAHPEFMFWLLQQPLVRRQIEVAATGTSGSMKNISQPAIRSLKIALPRLDEQVRIESRIRAVQETIAGEVQAVEKFRRQKYGLMQDLLTGKVRVKVEKSERTADG